MKKNTCFFCCRTEMSLVETRPLFNFSKSPSLRVQQDSSIPQWISPLGRITNNFYQEIHYLCPNCGARRRKVGRIQTSPNMQSPPVNSGERESIKAPPRPLETTLAKNATEETACSVRAIAEWETEGGKTLS
jgi:hypothetical protein